MSHPTLTANISVQKIELGGDCDFVVNQFILESNGKSYLKDVFIKYKEKLVARNYRESVEFVSMLDSLVKKGLAKGDENRFFRCVEKKIDGQIRKSLQCKFDRKRYIGVAEAKTMMQLYNESKMGYSLRAVLISDKVFSLQTDLEVDRKDVYLPSEEQLVGMINGELEKHGIKYDNTPYFSERISLLLHHVKYGNGVAGNEEDGKKKEKKNDTKKTDE